MAKFRNRVTQILGNIFSFTGPISAISSVELEAPIQPVFDIGPASALGKAADYGTSDGLIGIQLAPSAASATSAYKTENDIYGDMAALVGAPVDDLWVWVMDVSANATAIALTVGYLTIRDPEIQGTAAGNDRGRVLWYVNAVSPNRLQSGGQFVATNSGGPDARVHFPYLLTPGSDIQASIETSGAMILSVDVRLWVGPRFAAPPG